MRTAAGFALHLSFCGLSVTPPQRDVALDDLDPFPMQPTVIGIIPARFGSTRLPGKALKAILGKPMVQRVYERALRGRGTAVTHS